MEDRMEQTGTLSRAQQLQLDLMREVRFNNCNGQAVVDDLLEHRQLWRGVVMDRLAHDGSTFALIKLRDIAYAWNVDTLFILSSRAGDDALRALADGWSADAIEWIEGQEADTMLGASGDDFRILCVWWD
jgi:hypothetical protein